MLAIATNDRPRRAAGRQRGRRFGQRRRFLHDHAMCLDLRRRSPRGDLRQPQADHPLGLETQQHRVQRQAKPTLEHSLLRLMDPRAGRPVAGAVLRGQPGSAARIRIGAAMRGLRLCVGATGPWARHGPGCACKQACRRPLITRTLRRSSPGRSAGTFLPAPVARAGVQRSDRSANGPTR